MDEPTLQQRRMQADAFLDLSRLAALAEREVAARFEAEGLIGITPAQSRALMVLFQARRPMRARELSEAMGLAEVTVGRFVHALEAGGWVSRARDPEDGRAFLVQPTTQARQAFPLFAKVSNALMDSVFRGFTPEDQVRIAAVARRLRENLGEPSEDLAAQASDPAFREGDAGG